MFKYILIFSISFAAISAQTIDLTEHKRIFGKPSFNKYGISFVIRGKDWVAINKKKQYLFTAYNYDNGPDYISEGLMRYVENSKVGFVNERGKIIIKAQFDFASPFENGKAAFCNGCELKKMDEHSYYDKETGVWGYTNKKGKIVQEESK